VVNEPPSAINPADRLLDAIDRAGAPVCVGIDPVVERLPLALRPSGRDAQAAVAALVEFTVGVLDAVAPHVGCVKLQSACFERYRDRGVGALYGLIGEARRRGLQVVLDGKRGDIGVSAEHYAAAAFDPWPGDDADERPDWVTVNSYLGEDGIRPFMREGCGAFALVRTTNPGSDCIQDRELAAGETVAAAVAGMVASIGESSVGRRGYSALGAVVGATRPQAAKRLRQLMPRQIFLVPGFGAQGAGVEDTLACFNPDGTGAVVSASRSVIYAFDERDGAWTDTVAEAASTLARRIAQAVAGCSRSSG
jgi:orotidine-5'-phosphate decarboxylase